MKAAHILRLLLGASAAAASCALGAPSQAAPIIVATADSSEDSYYSSDSSDSDSDVCADYPRSLDAPPAVDPRPMFFLHMPKCGSSFVTILAEYGCPEWEHRALQGPDALDQRLCPGAFSRLEHGHAPLKKKEAEAHRGHIVTTVRPPRARVVSGFLANFHSCPQMQKRYGIEDRKGPREAWAGNITDALLLEYADCVEGCMVRMLTGKSCIARSGVRDITGERVERALAALDAFAFVGMTERWTESMCLFRAMFGGEIDRSVMENTRPSSEYTRNSTREQAWADEAELLGVLERHGWSDWGDEMVFAKAQAMYRDWTSQYLVG